MKASPVVIFDFDGTIADSFPKWVEVFHKLSAEFGYHDLTEQQIQELRNKSYKEIFKTVNISVFKIPFIVKRARVLLAETIPTTEPIKDLKEILLKLHKQGYKLGILTSNSQESVQQFLKNHDLEIFDLIYTGSSLFGKDKILKKLIKEQNLNPEDVIYIGDEVRDIASAQKVGIKIIAVSWGFSNKEILEKHQPSAIIDHPSQLISTIENI